VSQKKVLGGKSSCWGGMRGLRQSVVRGMRGGEIEFFFGGAGGGRKNEGERKGRQESVSQSEETNQQHNGGEKRYIEKGITGATEKGGLRKSFS